MRKIHSLRATSITALAVLLYACAFVFTVTAQEPIAKNAPAPTAATAPKIEEGKDKPIIVTKAQIEKSDSLAKDLKIAQLEANLAIPPELKARVDAAQKALDEYYTKEIGIARDKLSEYEISNGVDGALILRKKAAAAAPAPEKK